MAVDKNKIIAEATRLVQRGSLDKAIAAYRKILAADPKDVRILLKVGELHQRKGEAGPAAEAFGRVAETYADQGFFLKAIAVYKQIVRLDPGDARVSERLAALYQQLGLLSDAMAQLQRVAAAAEQVGDAARLGDVLRRMVELDPDDVASTVKLGELHARAGQAPLAVECLRRAAGQLKRQGRTDEYVRVAERLAALQPGELPLIRELANLHLARGDTKRALAKLQLCFKAEPGDVETLHLLAQAFRDLGQAAKVVSVYRELALVHAEQGRPGEAQATWQKVLELAPGDEEALAALEAAPADVPPPARAAEPPPRPAPAGPPRPPPVAEVQRAAPPVAPPRPPPAPPPAGDPPPAAVPARPASTPGALPSDPMARLLAEADVYAKYGLHDRALQHLGKVLELDPGSPDAHERARELHAAARRPAQSAEAGVAAVQALLRRGEAERARRALERLRELAPDHPDLPSLTSGADAPADVSEEISLETSELDLAPAPDVDEVEPAEILDPEPFPEEEGVALEVGEPEAELALELDPEDEVEVASPTPLVAQRAIAGSPGGAEERAVAGAAPTRRDAAAPAAPPEVARTPSAPPVHAARPPEPAPRAVPASASSPLRASPAAASPRALDAQPAAPPRPAPPAARPPSAPVAAAPAPAATSPGRPTPAPAPALVEEDLSDDLEVAEFFLEQGLVEEARDALRALAAAHPAHRGVRARLEALERGDPAPPAAARHPEHELARALEDDLGALPPDDPFQYSVEDVFDQFKKGVEQTIRPEDSATHYDLGIAYREMGLLDDAVHEFETALRGADGRRAVDCLSMLGACRMARGEPREAAAVYRRALASPHLTAEAAKALHFDLGDALEAAGDRELAVQCFRTVSQLDAGYRRVADRLAALAGPGGGTPAHKRSAGPRTPE